MKMILFVGVLTTCVCATASALTLKLTDAHLTYAPAVHIPDEARAKHLKGKGIFFLYVWSDGTVRKVQMYQSTGHNVLDKAAIEALAKWRFGGSRVAKVIVPMVFDGNYPPDKFR